MLRFEILENKNEINKLNEVILKGQRLSPKSNF